jgi:hypothetical protein
VEALELWDGKEAVVEALQPLVTEICAQPYKHIIGMILGNLQNS